jgi:uncharacterized paraquat-inducible protein A
MNLLIRFECPQCKQTMMLRLQDLAPGKRQVCTRCQTPGRMTEDSLERFSQDLRRYCLG